MSKKSNNLVGVTGEYYVCAELGKSGILALLTPKNNPLFDIVAVSPDAKRTVTIQVKTMSEKTKSAEKVKRQCEEQNVAFFFKQWGTWGSDGVKRSKKTNGRMLNGQEWNEFPIFK